MSRRVLFLLSAFLFLVVPLSRPEAAPVVARVDLSDRENFDQFQKLQVKPFFRMENVFFVELSRRQLETVRGLNVPTEIVDEQPFSGHYYVGAVETILSRRVPAAELEQLTDVGGYAFYKSAVPLDRAKYRRYGFEPIEVTKRELPLIYLPAQTAVIGPTPANIASVLDSLVAKISLDSVRAYDQRLEAFRTRLTFSDSNLAARDWIRQKFLGFGYTDVELQEFWCSDNGYGGSGYTYNVVCVKPGVAEPDKVIVIGGHYDSIVWDGSDPYVYAPGSDDNGSGTAGTLEIARVLAGVPTRKTIIFVPFAAEESGLWGSYYFVAVANYLGTDIELMLNMDMIGFTADSYPNVNCYNQAYCRPYAELMAQMATQYTTLVPQLKSAGGGSDHFPFYQYGYNFAYAEEGDFNTAGWHTPLDLTSRMNFPYMTDVVKMVLATGYAVSTFPGVVSDAVAHDVGDGQSLYVQWTPSNAPDIVGYRVYWGASSKVYTQQQDVPGSGTGGVTIDGLTEGQRYYLAVVAVDTAGNESFMRPEFVGTPRLVPLAPSGVAADPEDWRVRLAWAPNQEMDLNHYRIYRKVAPGSYSVLVDSWPGTFYADTAVQSGVMYDYVITAVDHDLHESAQSAMVTAAAATFDRGILIIDNTPPDYGNPTPEQKETFFATAFDKLPHAYYYFDAVTQDLNKSIIGQYSAVFWFDDGNAAGLWDPNDIAKLRWYLDHNTSLMLAGWRTEFEFAGLANNKPISAGNFLYDYAGITFIRENYDVDFRGGLGDGGLPNVLLDTAKVYEFWNGLMGWIGNFETDGTGQIIYRYDSYTGANTGLPVGVRRNNGGSKFAFLSMPLLYMRDTDGKALVQGLAEWFGFGPSCDCGNIGDCSGDGLINALDVVHMVNYVLRMTGPPPPTDANCPVINRGDWDCSGQVDMADVVKMVNYVYRYPAPGPCNPCPE